MLKYLACAVAISLALTGAATSSSADSPLQQQRAPRDAAAHLVVIVPENAELWFNGNKTHQTGTVREFVTPPLTPGKDYSYQLKARWMENDKPVEMTRTVHVQADGWHRIDLTRDESPSDKVHGAWRLIYYKSGDSKEYKKVPVGVEQVKLVADGRFVSTLVKGKKVIQMMGGRCLVEGEWYVEKITFLFDKQDEWLVSVPGAFRWRLEGNKWYHEGVIRGDKAQARITEVWERMPASPVELPFVGLAPVGALTTKLDGAWRMAALKAKHAKEYKDIPIDAAEQGTYLAVQGHFVSVVTRNHRIVQADGGTYSVTPDWYSMRPRFSTIALEAEDAAASKWRLDGERLSLETVTPDAVEGLILNRVK